MSDISIFGTVKESYAHVWERKEYFFRSLIFIFPLWLITLLAQFSLMKDASSPLIEVLIIYGLMIPSIFIHAAFALGWHRNVLLGKDSVPSPLHIRGNLGLFIKKTLWITLWIFLYTLLPVMVMSVGIGIAAVLPSLIAKIVFTLFFVLLGVGGLFYVYIMTLGYFFSLPAATFGLNLKIKEAQETSKPYRFKYALSIFVAWIPAFVALAIHGLFLQFLVVGNTGIGIGDITYLLISLPIGALQFFTVAISVVILCRFYKTIFGMPHSSMVE